MSFTAPPLATILVADAVPLLRYGLVRVLSQAFTSYQFQEAAAVPELLDLVRRLEPALVLVAANLPGTPAKPANLLTALRNLQPQGAVVVLTDPVETPEITLINLLRQNVSGLLPRTASVMEVCETVDTVLQRGRCYNEYTLALLRNQLYQPSKQRSTTDFSSRQLEVLHLIVKDLSNEEIAEHLCTSVRTVEYHRSQMLQKSGTRTTLGLVLFALRQGLLSTDKQLPAAAPVTHY